jgi:hypothetical protein
MGPFPVEITLEHRTTDPWLGIGRDACLFDSHNK